MISQDFLDILRCPLDPGRQARLFLEEDCLRCPQCGIRFRIRDGFPVLVIDDAELPPGCESAASLSARHSATLAGSS